MMWSMSDVVAMSVWLVNVAGCIWGVLWPASHYRVFGRFMYLKQLGFPITREEALVITRYGSLGVLIFLAFLAYIFISKDGFHSAGARSNG